MHTFGEKQKPGRPKLFVAASGNTPENGGTRLLTLDETCRAAARGRDVGEWTDHFHRDAAGAWKRFKTLSVYRAARLAGERPTMAPLDRPRGERADRLLLGVPRFAACYVVATLSGETSDNVRRLIDNSEPYQQARRAVRERKKMIADRRKAARRSLRNR